MERASQEPGITASQPVNRRTVETVSAIQMNHAFHAPTTADSAAETQPVTTTTVKTAYYALKTAAAVPRVAMLSVNQSSAKTAIHAPEIAACVVQTPSASPIFHLAVVKPN